LISFLTFYFFLRLRLNLAATILHIASQSITHVTLFFFVALLLIAQIVFSLLWLLAIVGSATNEADSHQGCLTYSFTGVYTISPQTTLSCPDNSSACQACVCDNGTRIASSSSACYKPKIFGSVLVGLLFVFLWVSNSIAGVVHCGIAKSAAAWWSANEGHPSELAMALGFRKALTTNFGSIALGSLVVSAIQLARGLCEFAARALQGGGGGGVGGQQASTRCSLLRAFALSCISAALETLTRASSYFSRYAFVYVAIFDLTFIDASRAVCGLFAQRGWTALVNDDLIETVLMFAQVAVGVAVVGCTYGFSKAVGLNPIDSLLLAITGYFVGASVCGTATRALVSASATIFVCFAERPDAFAAAHPDLSILLHAAWGELGLDVKRGVAPPDSGDRSLDEEAAVGADVLSPQYVRKQAPYMPPAALPAAVGGDDDDDDDDEKVLDIAPLTTKPRG